MRATTKKITLVQMGVTLLRNTRKELHGDLRVPWMVSGYPKDFKRGVIESAVALSGML